MHARSDVNTAFHIDLDWWDARGRSLDRFLREMLDGEEPEDLPEGPMDTIDRETGEVFQLGPLWARVLTERANRPGFITSATPMTNAVLRALIERRNQPMTVVELHRRINRGSPQALLRMLRAARQQYGIVPVLPEA